VVTYTDQAELVGLLDELEPGLTATIQGEEDEAELVRGLLPSLTRLAGRLLWNDWPTGVTVSWAQQHGGPYPGTTAPTSTSVGTAAIERFLRPVAWQGFPTRCCPRHCRRPTPGSCPPHRRKALSTTSFARNRAAAAISTQQATAVLILGGLSCR